VNKQYKNIIFDLGAVLLYFNPREILQDLFKNEREVPFDLAVAPQSIEWLQMDKGIVSPHQVAYSLAHKFNEQHLLKFILELPRYLKPLSEGLDIFYKVKNAGYKTFVLSNLSRHCYEQVVCSHNFLKDFDGHIYSYQIKKVKPELSIYKHLLKTYDLRAEDCLFIDDLKQNIQAANEIGIQGILCSSHENVLKELKGLKII
jgi:putative hydrolase of the HAD superfamily